MFLIFGGTDIPAADELRPVLAVVAFVEQTVTVSSRLGEIVDVTAALVNTSVMLSGRAGGRVSAHDWDISIGSPLLAPANPLDVVVYYNQAEDLSCSFTKI